MGVSEEFLRRCREFSWGFKRVWIVLEGLRRFLERFRDYEMFSGDFRDVLAMGTTECLWGYSEVFLGILR